jgi:aspartate racemase
MIIIGGGVGPMAGVLLHRKIIEATRTDGTDQDHLEVLHISRSPIIGDRTEYLQGKDVPDPAEGMFRVLHMATAAMAAEGSSDYPAGKAVAGIPCNTFHAPEIFRKFLSLLDGADIPVQTVNMIDETVQEVAARVSSRGTVGLLSTTGTRVSGVYHDYFRSGGYTVLEIPEEEQPALHEAIYHRAWGLKAVSPPDGRAVDRVFGYARELVRAGAEIVILGCTELPLAVPEGLVEGVPTIDPMTALARALVREEAPEKLRPLQEGGG